MSIDSEEMDSYFLDVHFQIVANVLITRWLQLDGRLNPILGIVGCSYGPLGILPTSRINTKAPLHIGIFRIYRLDAIFLPRGAFITIPLYPITKDYSRIFVSRLQLHIADETLVIVKKHPAHTLLILHSISVPPVVFDQLLPNGQHRTTLCGKCWRETNSSVDDFVKEI